MKKIFLAGHNGMVGQAIYSRLMNDPDIEILTQSRSQLDLTNQADVSNYLSTSKPDEVILAAAKVGGINANNIYPAEFIYQNLQIQNNIIHESHRNNIQKLLFLGSSCIYPKLAQQPISEKSLLTGNLEPTNEPYAISKIAGIKLCESYNRQYGRDYRSVMPTNLYGLGDNYNPENSHVVPALIRRFHEAKVNSLDKVVVWGTGNARREFLYVDDMASACIFIHTLEKYIYDECTDPMLSHINIGSGNDIFIRELALIIKKVIGYSGKIEFDTNKPDGAPRKLLNVDLIKKLGWKPSTPIEKGIKLSYTDFLNNFNSLRQ